MPASVVYRQVRSLLDQHLDERVDESSRDRLALLVLGILRAKSASPARIAAALNELGLSAARVDSIERRIRRIENDPEVQASLCFHPLARMRLLLGRPSELRLILDPTTQDDRLVMLTAAVWYRGRALPLAWAVWPANTPLAEERFWQRVEALLDLVARLLPAHVPITWLADRAFGSPSFTDLVVARHWHYVVRVQGQTRCKDRQGRERQVRHLVRLPRQRAKLRGLLFKKRGWRFASAVVYWGRGHAEPLCLVSNLPAHWHLVHLYRQRYSLEATFRDYKSSGWEWERGQVCDLAHVKRLLVGMALAMWLALCAGTQAAAQALARPPTGRRHSLPWEGKRSLFSLGLQRLHAALSADQALVLRWQLTDWTAPNWQTQIRAHHARASVFA